MNYEKQPIMKSGEDYMFVMEYENYTNECMSNIVGNITIIDHKNEIVFLVCNNFTKKKFNTSKDYGKIEYHVKDINLTTGTYTSILFTSFRNSEILDLISYANKIIVEVGNFFGIGSIGLPSHCKALNLAEWKAI